MTRLPTPIKRALGEPPLDEPELQRRFSGVLARGTLERTALHGATLHQLVRALRQDNAYVTVHTRAHPGGEIRGQLRIQPVVASR